MANIVSSLSIDSRDGSWPELLPAVYSLCGGPDPMRRELALHTLAQLAPYLFAALRQDLPQVGPKPKGWPSAGQILFNYRPNTGQK